MYTDFGTAYRALATLASEMIDGYNGGGIAHSLRCHIERELGSRGCPPETILAVEIVAAKLLDDCDVSFLDLLGRERADMLGKAWSLIYGEQDVATETEDIVNETHLGEPTPRSLEARKALDAASSVSRETRLATISAALMGAEVGSLCAEEIANQEDWQGYYPEAAWDANRNTYVYTGRFVESTSSGYAILMEDAAVRLDRIAPRDVVRAEDARIVKLGTNSN